MQAPLADGVFMVVCGEDVVVLNIHDDHYSCLPEAGAHLKISLSAAQGPEPLLADLADAGLTGAKESGGRCPSPPLPDKALDLSGARPRMADNLCVVRAISSAWSHGPGRRPFAELLLGSEPPENYAVDVKLIARLTLAFTRLLPWAPAQGACLYRAWLLRRILQSRGQTATWVFGVRTWPFGAHCWLQVDRFVLDDEPDRVAHYTPIMAV